MCGFVHSTFLTVPVNSTGLLVSNSADTEWWARAGVTAITVPIASTASPEISFFIDPLLLRLRATATRKHPTTIRGSNGGLADVQRILALRANPFHGHFLADFQRVLAPALTEQRVRRTTFDA